MTREKKIQLIERLREKKRRKLKADFYQFFKWAWDIIVTEPLKEQPYHKYICDEVQIVAERVLKRLPKDYDLIINVPPGSSKTIIINQMLNAWMWTRDPSIRVISTSSASALAMESSEKTRDLILSDEFKRLFGNVELKKDSTGKSNYKTSKMGQRYTTSVGATVTGIHAHIKLHDDLINVEDANSETKRKEANNFLFTTLRSRNVDDSITANIMIMQRLHVEDPTGEALAKWKRVKHIVLPAELSERVSPPECRNLYTDGLLDPTRKPRNILEEAKTELGSYSYAGQYEQSPAPDEGGMFKKAWFKRITRVDFEKMNEDFLVENPIEWTFACDTAYTKDQSNDPSGIMSVCHINNNMFIRMYQDQYLEFPELVKWIPIFANKYGYSSSSRIYVEPKASGKSAVQMLHRYSDLNIIEDKPPSVDKVARARGTTAIAEAGRVFIITDYDNEPEEWIDTLVHQMAVFPNGKHDETVDVFGIHVRRLELGAGRVIDF